MIATPGYIDRDTWEAFIVMRKEIKKPLTTFAAKLVVYELHRIKEAGHCPNAALRQSILNCWKDVWPAKEKVIEKASGSQAEETKQWLDSQRQTPSERAASEDARRIAMGALKVVR